MDEPVYLCGDSDEQNSAETDYNVLNLESGSLTEAQVSELAHKILLKNADEVCIQEVATDDHAYSLYKALHKKHAHFVYVPPSLTLNVLTNHRKRGMLIASKFSDTLEILLARSSRGGGDDRQSGGGWEVGVDVKYGGKDEPQFDGYVSGEAHDDKGNYVEGRVDHNFNSNEGTVGFRGGNKDEENR